jgi:hypothetical protein
MKLELQKQTDHEGTWYVVIVDGSIKVTKRDLKDAQEIYQYYLSKRIKEIVTLKSIEL